MKVLILANNDVGLYKFRKELIEELLKEHEVFICLPNGDFIKELVFMGCKFIPCDLLDRHGTNPIKELKLIFLYKKVLIDCKPDIVFTYTIKPNVYGGIACASMDIPYVVNVTGLGTAVENPGVMQFVTINLYKYGLRKAQKVFFQNTENRDFMVKKGTVKGDYDILPGSGVNLNDYIVFEYPNGDTVDFVFVSRIMKEKGIDQYLDAAKGIRKKHPETRNPGAGIGTGCIVNTSSSVDHDCVIGNYVHVAVGAHLSGTVNVGEGTWIGTGSTISNNVNICGGCMIGAGAVVIKNIDVPGTYIGVPAKMI